MCTPLSQVAYACANTLWSGVIEAIVEGLIRFMGEALACFLNNFSLVLLVTSESAAINHSVTQHTPLLPANHFAGKTYLVKCEPPLYAPCQAKSYVFATSPVSFALMLALSLVLLLHMTHITLITYYSTSLLLKVFM